MRKTTSSPPRNQLFNITTILKGNAVPVWITVSGELEGVSDGDLVLIDGGRKRPRDGDLVAWGIGPYDGEGLTLGFWFKRNGKDPRPVFGIGTAIVRKLQVKKPRQPRAEPKHSIEPELRTLRANLSRLERLPENESERFRLMTEIYDLEHQTHVEEWPDVIGGGL